MRCELCEQRDVYHVFARPMLVLNVCQPCFATLSQPMRLEGCVVGPAWVGLVERYHAEFRERCERMVDVARELCSAGEPSGDSR